MAPGISKVQTSQMGCERCHEHADRHEIKDIAFSLDCLRSGAEGSARDFD